MVVSECLWHMICFSDSIHIHSSPKMFAPLGTPSHGGLPHLERLQPRTPSAPSRPVRPVALLVVGVAVGWCRCQRLGHGRYGVLSLRAALSALVVGGTGRVGGSTTRWLKKLSLENNLELNLSVGGRTFFGGWKKGVFFLFWSFQLRVHEKKQRPWKYQGHWTGAFKGMILES